MIAIECEVHYYSCNCVRCHRLHWYRGRWSIRSRDMLSIGSRWMADGSRRNMSCMWMGVGSEGLGLLVGMWRSIGVRRTDNQSCCIDAASCLRWANTFCLLKHPSPWDNACAGLGWVTTFQCVASGGHSWPSPCKLARRGGPTSVGACPPSGVTDAADVLILSSVTTALAMRSASPIAISSPSIDLHLPLPRFLLVHFAVAIWSRPKRVSTGRKMNRLKKPTKSALPLLGKGGGNWSSSPFFTRRCLLFRCLQGKSVEVSDHAPISVMTRGNGRNGLWTCALETRVSSTLFPCATARRS